MTPESPPQELAMPTSSLPQAVDSNTKQTTGPAQTRAYPWLLLASTAVSAVFCFMYITKPVIILSPPLALEPVAATPQPLIAPEKPAVPAVAAVASLLPNAQQLPGDNHPPQPATQPPPRANLHPNLPVPTVVSAFEETNLQIQHILTAKTPNGDLSRIVLNVPVLYQTRTLGWTHDEVAEALELLKRLTTYQENSRSLREEGTRLLAAWNLLVEHSIPTPGLRADSPSLPANQTDAHSTEKPAGLDTADSIQIQPADP
ncbi:MAG: hypothetical protein WCO57_00695 [Verrucomicrobiota bacterium]